MRNALSVVVVALLACPACQIQELDPTPSPVLESPELSEAREPHKTADTTPPIRERRLDTSPESSKSLVLDASVSPVATPSTTIAH